MIESILEKVSFNNAEFAFYKESLKSYNAKEIMSEHDYESVDKALKEFLPFPALSAFPSKADYHQ